MAVLIPALAVAPVFIGDLEALEGGLFPLLEALELGLLVDAQPELHQHHIPIHQLLLEIIDFRIGTQPLIRRAEAFDPLDQHTPVPGAVENGELAALRHVAPEAPEPGLRQLLVGGRGDLHGAVKPWIQRPGDSPDRTALARRIVSFEQREHPAFAQAAVAQQLRQARLLRHQLLLVIVLAQLL